MRKIGDKADAYAESARKLRPPGGTTVVGGEHKETEMRGDVLRRFLFPLPRLVNRLLRKPLSLMNLVNIPIALHL